MKFVTKHLDYILFECKDANNNDIKILMLAALAALAAGSHLGIITS